MQWMLSPSHSISICLTHNPFWQPVGTADNAGNKAVLSLFSAAHNFVQRTGSQTGPSTSTIHRLQICCTVYSLWAAIWGHQIAFSIHAALGVLLLSCRLQFYFAPFQGGCVLKICKILKARPPASVQEKAANI